MRFTSSIWRRYFYLIKRFFKISEKLIILNHKFDNKIRYDAIWNSNFNGTWS